MSSDDDGTAYSHNATNVFSLIEDERLLRVDVIHRQCTIIGSSRCQPRFYRWFSDSKIRLQACRCRLAEEEPNAFRV